MKSISLFQKLGWVYAVMFFIIGFLAFIPGTVDKQGYVFGLFTLDWWDNALHLGSGLWAGVAAWRSRFAASLYFQLLGVLYGLDGVLGFFLGQGYLDGGLFIYGITPIDWTTKFLANIPHIAIGGIAVAIGFWLSRQFPETNVAASA
jgi:hypothetical protein